jgi:hypothetical protein
MVPHVEPMGLEKVGPAGDGAGAIRFLAGGAPGTGPHPFGGLAGEAAEGSRPTHVEE